jgi:DNA-binding NarL/FixJ family response regulator
MKIILVDNDPEDRDLRRLRDHAADDLGWNVKWLRPSPDLSQTCSEIIKESDDADVLMVDIALTPEEEEELEYLSNSSAPVERPERFGGMRICLRISSELPNLPIVLFSKFEKVDLVRQIYWVGAKLFVTKGTPSDATCNMLVSLSRRMSVREPCLVDALRERLRSEPRPWEAASVEAACEEYYKNIHGHRRFAILCAKMELPLAKVCPSKTGMDEFIRYMIESHDLMAVSDRTVPDHIRHSGNVFFVGHYLLNRLNAFQVLERFPHYSPQAFSEGGGNERFEQLNLAWLLTSLFHDSGYALEHSKTVVACLSRIAGTDLSRMEGKIFKGFDVAAEIKPLV